MKPIATVAVMFLDRLLSTTGSTGVASTVFRLKSRSQTGVGFEPAILVSTGDGLTGGMGLRLMLERVEQIGGTRAIESNTGEGTSVVVQLPTPPTMPRRSAGVVEVS